MYKLCHHPDLCAKASFSSSRSDGVILAAGFNPGSLLSSRDNRSLMKANHWLIPCSNLLGSSGEICDDGDELF
jgi:hypothetical protein